MANIVDISEVLLELGIAASPTDNERAVAFLAAQRASGEVRRFLHYDPLQATRTEYLPQRADYGVYNAIWETEGDTAFLRRETQASSNDLQVRHIPIRSITSLSIDYDGRHDEKSGAFATAKTEGTDFWATNDGQDADGNKYCLSGIIRSIGLWPNTSGSVKIVYVAGYTAAELRGSDPVIDASPIWSTCLSEAVRRSKHVLSSGKSDRLGFIQGALQSEKLGDYSYQLATVATNRMFSGTYGLLPESRERLNGFVNWGWSLEG